VGRAQTPFRLSPSNTRHRRQPHHLAANAFRPLPIERGFCPQPAEGPSQEFVVFFPFFSRPSPPSLNRVSPVFSHRASVDRNQLPLQGIAPPRSDPRPHSSLAVQTSNPSGRPKKISSAALCHTESAGNFSSSPLPTHAGPPRFPRGNNITQSVLRNSFF